jgi:hypothetical protein
MLGGKKQAGRHGDRWVGGIWRAGSRQKVIDIQVGREAGWWPA